MFGADGGAPPGQGPPVPGLDHLEASSLVHLRAESATAARKTDKRADRSGGRGCRVVERRRPDLCRTQEMKSLLPKIRVLPALTCHKLSSLLCVSSLCALNTSSLSLHFCVIFIPLSLSLSLAVPGLSLSFFGLVSSRFNDRAPPSSDDRGVPVCLDTGACELSTWLLFC